MITSLVLAQCFVLTDPSPGWKQVALPPEAPQLAAPDGVEQFRTSDPVVVTSTSLTNFLSSWRGSPGRQDFEFFLPKDTRRVTIRFGRSLDSAKVDATLDGDKGRVTLLDERRVATDELTFENPLPGENRLRLSVHHHLREAPSVSGLQLDRVMTPSNSDFPAQFKLDGALYVLSTGGPLTLCQRPTQKLTVSSQSLERPAVRSVPLLSAKAR